MSNQEIGRWFKLGLISLAIVALYGMIMRYKIAFNLPIFDQKNLLHAHSHFAFSGWVTHALYCGMMLILSPHLTAQSMKKYKWLTAFNLIVALGMLIGFTIQGYKPLSISFSTLSIVIAICFAYAFLRDARKISWDYRPKRWAIAGLLLNVLSSIGPFYLAYIMMTKMVNTKFYLASVYYYLHFQYSGWFFFGSMAIIIYFLPKSFPDLTKYFRLFAWTIIPTFFLSTLWLDLPDWLYILTLIATMIQLYAWVAMLWKVKPFFTHMMNDVRRKWLKLFFVIAVLALTLKFILQAISVIPSLSQLVFGFRPIVIAYLHLVLLGVYSLFFVSLFFANGYVPMSRMAKFSAYVFLIGIALNESLLAVQGIGAFAYIPIPHINEMLLIAALVLFTSATSLAIASRVRSS